MNIERPLLKDYNEISNFANNNNLFVEGLDRDKFISLMKYLYKTDGKNFIKSIHIAIRENNKLIAHYGATCRKLIINGETLNVALASNLIISKGISKPLFFIIQKEFIRQYRKLQYNFAYAIVTRQNIISPHIPMKWNIVNHANVFVRPISISNCLKKLHPLFNIHPIKIFFEINQKIYNLIFFRKNNGIKISTHYKFDKSYNEFLNNNLYLKDSISLKNLDTLNNRFKKFDGREYIILKATKKSKIVGYLVMREMIMKGLNVIAIVDIVYEKNNKKIFNALISSCINYAEEKNTDLVATIFTNISPHKLSYYKNGFIKTNEKFTLISHTNDFENKNEYINTLKKKWDFTWFEHDFV